MCHLTKHSSVRACDSLDRAVRSIDIPLFIHGNIALRVTILGCYLSICKEFCKPFLVSDKTSLSMRCRIGIYSAKFCFLKPWRFVGNHFGIYHLGNMASNCIVCQCRCILILSYDISVWYKTKLDQCLESITDTKCQTISLIQKLLHCLFQLCVLECSCKEFG